VTDARTRYFDSIADKWDGWMDLDRTEARLREGLARFEIGPDEAILDVGCGTGNLTRALLAFLSERGRVTALDPSARMLELAREKQGDRRVTFLQGQASDLVLGDGTMDRVICFSVWPHLEDPRRTLRELGRVLKGRGWLHVWHIDSRETINRIHAGAGEAVQGDMLIPGAELAGLARLAGFEVTETLDSAEEYLVSARKAE
jgi:demethylmenaquinone methyltransferase/2-methoxy-6-polyprenyl-1,4-benzoquinol methylase